MLPCYHATTDLSPPPQESQNPRLPDLLSALRCCRASKAARRRSEFIPELLRYLHHCLHLFQMPFRHKTKKTALPIRTLSHTAATSMLNIYKMDQQWTSSSDLFIRNMLSGNKHAFQKEPAIIGPKSSALQRPTSPVPRTPTQ